jgi:predicted metal-binding membrane protein
LTDGIAGALAYCGHAPGAAWDWDEAVAQFAMWQVMIAAMMAPVVAPWLLALARRHQGVASLPGFLAGYSLVWAASGIAATALQWTLSVGGLLSAGQFLDHPWVAGACLVAVGAYQWTPVKDACIRHCQSPMSFMLAHWRDGTRGAVWMGARHGIHCVGCCWPLMTLMLLAGAMSPIWMAAVAAFALAEMYVPRLRPLPRLAGTGLAALGALLPILG